MAIKVPKVPVEDVLAVLDKAENGPVVEEKDWDRGYINQIIGELVERYDITWDRDNPGVPSDDALADRVFEAGMTLAVQSGLYCVDTRRQMTWTREELERIVADAPVKVTVGEGMDEVTFCRRDTDETPPFHDRITYSRKGRHR